MVIAEYDAMGRAAHAGGRLDAKTRELFKPGMAIGPRLEGAIFPVIAALADAVIAHDLPPHIVLPAACQVIAGAAALVTLTERSPNSLNLDDRHPYIG